MLAIGNEELEGAEDLKESVECHICGGIHEVKYGEKVLEDGTKVPSKMLAFFNCGDKTYLCGIDGKRIKPPEKKPMIKSIEEYKEMLSECPKFLGTQAHELLIHYFELEAKLERMTEAKNKACDAVSLALPYVPMENNEDNDKINALIKEMSILCGKK